MVNETETSERSEVRIAMKRVRCAVCEAGLDVPQFPGVEDSCPGRCVFCGKGSVVEEAVEGPHERVGRTVEEPLSEQRFHDLWRWWVDEELRREIRQHWTFRADRWISRHREFRPSLPFTPPEVFQSKTWARCVYLPFWLRDGTGAGEAPAFAYAGRGLPEALLLQMDLQGCLDAAPSGGTAQLDLPVEPVHGEEDPSARLVHVPLQIAAYVDGADAFRLLRCPRTGQYVAFEPPLSRHQLPDGRRWLIRHALIALAAVLFVVALYLFVAWSIGDGEARPPPPAPIPPASLP